MKNSIAVPLVIGLTIFLVLLAMDVVDKVPPGKDDDENLKMRILINSSGLYFAYAQNMIEKLVGPDTRRWSHLGSSRDTLCRPVGNGVWYARGYVEKPDKSGTLAVSIWELIFVAEQKQMLCARVDDAQWGDYAGALKRAGVQPPATPSNHATK